MCVYSRQLRSGHKPGLVCATVIAVLCLTLTKSESLVHKKSGTAVSYNRQHACSQVDIILANYERKKISPKKNNVLCLNRPLLHLILLFAP